MNHPVLNTWKGENPVTDALSRDIGTWFTDNPFKAVMGWDGIIIHENEIDPVDMLAAYASFVFSESCGQCAPCRLGTERIKTLSENIGLGKGQMSDLDTICHIAKEIGLTARCDLGRTMGQPIMDLIEHCKADFADVIHGKRPTRKGTYVMKITAPCISACPSHVNIPSYIENVRMGNFRDAMDAVREGCPMPGTIGRVCVRPCETACKRGDLDEPVSIRAIKRFLADKELRGEMREDVLPEVKHTEKVAIVGAGPAGLSCAYYLGKKGYAATIFESQEGPGGMAAYGIPSYRLPRHVISHEVDIVRKFGADIRYNTAVGTDITMAELAKQGYKAVFLGMGAPMSSRMRCEGEDEGYAGFMPGVDFLAASAREKKPLSGEKVVVIGGGNVAMDCVRTSKRLGFQDVRLLYRRTEAEMPADPHEIREAKEEGVAFDFLVAPVRIISENNAVKGLTCIKMKLGEPDESGRRRPVPIKGSEFLIDCDAIIPAVGQTCVADTVVPEDSGLTTSWKTLVANNTTFQTDAKHIFGGGDCVTGPKTLIAALAAGKNAARYIDEYLKNGSCRPENADLLNEVAMSPVIFDGQKSFPFPGITEKAEGDVLDPEIRINSFDEVEDALSSSQARMEAERCLRCYRMIMAAV